MVVTTTREIRRADWPFYFDIFSRQHESWLVTVQVLGSDIGAQVEGRSLRFEGITADLKEGSDSIAIMLGKVPDAHITHVISSPVRVMLERSEIDRGTFETLEIESANGERTLVSFLAGVLPEMLDGIA